MVTSKNSLLPRVILVVMVCLVLLAAGTLAWLLLHPAAIRPGPSAGGVPAPIATDAPPTPGIDPTAQPSPTAAHTATPGPTAIPVELGETPDAGQEYIDKIVFLGDSTTYGLYAYDLVPLTQVWTDSIGTLALFNWATDPIAYRDPAAPDGPSESLSIAECAARRKPEYLIITLGINGIAFLDEEQFKDYYRDMLDAIIQASPDTKIICNSIYPVDDRYTPGGVSSQGVNDANVWIRAVAEEKGLRYLNSHDALMDENGQLRSDYSGDTDMGIHMNGTGLNALLAFIRTHAYQ